MAGSFIIGAWTVLVERFTKHLTNFTGKAAVCAGVLLGAQALEIVLPSYNVEASGAVVVFLVIYSALAMFIGKLLNERYSDAN